MINDFRKEHGLTSLVVCSRIEEYSAIDRKLSLVGAITLQALASKQTNSYIDCFGKSVASVKQLLIKDNSLQELAETPLMLSFMVLAYKHRAADHLVGFKPKNAKKHRKYLFDSYIFRMFERSNRTENPSFRRDLILHYLGKRGRA